MDTYPTNGNDVGSVIPPNEKEVAVLLTSISTTEMETTSTTTTTTTTVATTTLPPSKFFLFIISLIEKLWKTNFFYFKDFVSFRDSISQINILLKVKVKG